MIKTAQPINSRPGRQPDGRRDGVVAFGKSVIPRPQWPRPVFKQKRAIISAEHAAIVARELNPERRDFYELLWHTGASQTVAACLTAEDVNWNTRTISYCRRKLKSRAGIKPALFPSAIRPPQRPCHRIQARLRGPQN